ncbi:hypothetical protein EIN_469590 [Entamoeba invadens IP1]|uniref:tRNA-intron lyase n=1 Tax=Entamoeba invadens IP1 TaxID=370355 RepID=A0A0A1TUL0_ENTIV|nr:hypothetical protein EIN_469590 [Entamoeba invadens IP1]ELP83745.1 hypothetical protein EIN_469590 [Entamoeba invadens IP1]|eukprot:XP_004183091.1 hypothetical protein EIN_469590 [Entamoeba invadens IP1]
MEGGRVKEIRGLLVYEGSDEVLMKYDFGKSVGAKRGRLTEISTLQGVCDVFPKTVALSKFEAKFLIENEQVKCESLIPLSQEEDKKYQLFSLLINKGYFVKDGFKYACDFMVYKKNPKECHSYGGLVIMGLHNIVYRDILGYCRLLHAVKKVLLLAYENGSSYDVQEMEWETLDNH